MKEAITHCPHVGTCGGCQSPLIPNDQQVEQKQNEFLQLLQTEANVQPQTVLPAIRGNRWGYRRKARLSVKYVIKKDKVLVGFRELNGRYVADIDRCETLHPRIGHTINEFKTLFYQLTIRDKIPQMEIAISDDEVAIVLRHLTIIPEQDRNKLRQFAEAHQFKLFFQPKGLDSIYLDWPANGQSLLQYRIPQHQLTLQFSPQQFIQVNSEINQQMIGRALALLELQASDRVIDLFCGIGNFSLPLAKHCQQVVGVEGDKAAVLQAAANARYNGLSNTEFHCDDLREPLYNNNWAAQYFDKAVLDPPRSGAKALIPWMVTHKIMRIVYISCNPETLAHDTKLLLDAGYKLKKAGVIDMFPHTKHIEAMALFEQ